jgi:hypothetical protein
MTKNRVFRKVIFTLAIGVALNGAFMQSSNALPHATPSPTPESVPPASSAELAALPVMCVEEAIPSLPTDGISGPTFSEHDWLADILTETHGGILDETSKNFHTNYSALGGARDAPAKMREIYAAANANDMPPQILTGALIQESDMLDLSISTDANNWSCGIGQINLLEWCAWANQETPEVKSRIHWPSAEVAQLMKENPETDLCSGYFMRAAFAKPFYDIGTERLVNARPQVVKTDLDMVLSEKNMLEPKPIAYDDLSWALDNITRAKMSCPHRNRYNEECLTIKPVKNEVKAAYLRYLMAKSFAENCSLHENGIPAKAYNLRLIHDALPASIKAAQQYPEHSTYARTCLLHPTTRAYPLSVSWMLADTVYNAGEEILPGIYEYWKRVKWTPEEVGPEQLAVSVDYALKEKKVTKHMADDGVCESQFHIRSVVKNMTLPGDENVIVDPAPPISKKCQDVQDRDNHVKRDKNGKIIHSDDDDASN